MVFAFEFGAGRAPVGPRATPVLDEGELLSGLTHN